MYTFFEGGGIELKKNKLHKKSNSAIYAQSFESGKDFVKLRSEAVERDLIAPTQTVARRKIAKYYNMSLKELELDYLSKCDQFVASKPTVEVLSNSSGSASKATLTLDGHALNPLQQAKDSSARVVEYSHAYKVMEGLFETTKELNLQNKMYQFKGDRLYAYNGTLNFKNSSIGSLAKEVKDLNTMASSLWKRLKDAHMRDGLSNRLVVAGEVGKEEYAVPVAMLISNEVTIKPERLKKMDGTEIFNQHIHFTLFTDRKLSDTVADDLYVLWDDITGKYSTSRDAFEFKPAYSATAEDDSITSTLKETTKYLMDPSKWDVLALNENDSDDMREFKIEVFAEYYNAYTNIKRMKTLGLLRDAMSYISRFSQFENASVFNKSDILGELLTQLNELKYNHKAKRYEFNHVRLLTDDEIIHENKTYLSNILVPKEYKDALDSFVDGIVGELKNDKDKLYAEYFKMNEFNSSLQDFYDVLDEAEMEDGNKLYSMDKDVFSSEEFKKEFNESFDYRNYNHFTKYRDLKMKQASTLRGNNDYLHRQIMKAIELVGRLCDIELLRKAIGNLVNSEGTKIKYSRDEIDARIFKKRLTFRQAINAKPTVEKDVTFSNMFYEENGMTLPLDGRETETVELYVDDTDDYEEWFELFRVPEDKRDALKDKLGLVTPNYIITEDLPEFQFKHMIYGLKFEDYKKQKEKELGLTSV